MPTSIPLNVENALNGTNFEPITDFYIQGLVSTALNLALVFGALVSFFFLIWGAVQWISSGGDKEGLEKAKKKITGALVGLVILFSVFAIGSIAQTVFDVNIFQLCIPGITAPCSTP
mgnify:CR=1 FL=1